MDGKVLFSPWQCWGAIGQARQVLSQGLFYGNWSRAGFQMGHWEKFKYKTLNRSSIIKIILKGQFKENLWKTKGKRLEPGTTWSQLNEMTLDWGAPEAMKSYVEKRLDVLKKFRTYLISELLHGSHGSPSHNHTVGRLDNFLKLKVSCYSSNTVVNFFSLTWCAGSNKRNLILPADKRGPLDKKSSGYLGPDDMEPFINFCGFSREEKTIQYSDSPTQESTGFSIL